MIRGGTASKANAKPAKQAEKGGQFISKNLRIEIKEDRKGLAVKVRGEKLQGSDLDILAKKIAALFID